MLKVSIVVGNPKPRSRTRQIAEKLIERILQKDSYYQQVIELSDYTDRLHVWPSDEMSALNASVASSNLVVLASPTYKATYTGLLKVFLDRYPANGLRGVVGIPVMTGADLTHSLGPRVNLAPLMAELGAIVPLLGFYFVTSHMDQINHYLDASAEQFHLAMSTMLPIISACAGNCVQNRLEV